MISLKEDLSSPRFRYHDKHWRKTGIYFEDRIRSNIC